MHPPLEEWDEAYATDASALDESLYLEKKRSGKFDTSGSKKDLKEVLAKAISAFSNTDGGSLVFGLCDAGGFDAGIENVVGNESATHWIEKVASSLVSPTVFDCRAKFVSCPAHHAAGRGILVVSVPKSELRPHWITTGKQEAYLRVGARSEPMSRQTFLDISSRGSQSRVEISDLQIAKETATQWSLKPFVTLVGGPVCHDWMVDMLTEPDGGRLLTSTNSNHKQIRPSYVSMKGTEPLFRSRTTAASPHGIRYQGVPGRALTEFRIVVRAYAASMPPVQRTFDLL